MPAVDQAPPHGAIVDPSELAAVPGSMLDAAKAYAADVLSLPAEPAPRALPVTPAERACATVLRAWLEWTPDPNRPDPEDAERVMMALGDSLADRGFLEDGLSTTPAGAALLARVEAAPVPDAPPMFYIQDTRSYVGNAVLWWRPNGNGYTTNIDDAGQYTEAEARRICRSRASEKMIPAAAVRAATSRVVDADALHTALAGTTPIDAPPAKEHR